MRTDDFDFVLPEERIALHAAEPRDSARLLEVGCREARAGHATPGLVDRRVSDLPDLLRPGDVLVFNDTRVIPAALTGERPRGDAVARIHVNLHKRVDPGQWCAFVRPARKLEIGDTIRFRAQPHVGPTRDAPADETLAGIDAVPPLEARVVAKGSGGEVQLAFDQVGPDLDRAIAAVGEMPLPPYIAARRGIETADRAAYQTIYAARDGAVAAPTAGLHFTDRLMQRLSARGVGTEFLTLHVGAGTFLPVKAEEIADHRMHAEWGEVSADLAQRLNQVRAAGGRLIGVGTTVTRLLESAADADGQIQPFVGETDIFITPGYRFRAIDAMWTNFHLPRSTLFMLVCAFAGTDTMKRAYSHAISSGYRFYSYGDASLLWPSP